MENHRRQLSGAAQTKLGRRAVLKWEGYLASKPQILLVILCLAQIWARLLVHQREPGTSIFCTSETRPKTRDPRARWWAPLQTQGTPQGPPSRAQDRTATALDSLVITRVKWRDAQVWKQKWILQRSRFAAEYIGIVYISSRIRMNAAERGAA